ncbi:MAG: hypothetical protein HOP16_09230 [Acidobacteria bacterium]|nr:hypothetical protein [Acidobacteriota bacterium]
MQELRELPARVAGVELQIVQLREEMRGSFSAIRTELGGKVDGLRDELRGEMHGMRGELLAEIRQGDQATRDRLLAEIRLGDQATRDFMRMLFEHHQSNLKTIGEGTKKRKR